MHKARSFSPGPLVLLAALLVASATRAQQPVTVPDAIDAEGQTAADANTAAKEPPKTWGAYEPGKGFVLVRAPLGEVDFSVFTYVRYLNQKALHDTYTDAFGRTQTLHLRGDLQLQKVTLNFKGWLLDERFRYIFYTWTANTSQGLGAQVVVAGNLSYELGSALTLSAGIGSLPTTRTTNWTFPNWLRVDNRTLADEFFRGSYTTGFWASGALAKGLEYRVMIGNNLSQLGVDASQLDPSIDTFSAALWWMPTTHEYGPALGFGDFEAHDRVATLFGGHFTHSHENREAQPGVNEFENSQIRLSDGTRVFQPAAFGTVGQIQEVLYDMTDVNAGLKYEGLSLDAEYYFRWVHDFRVIGDVPVTHLFDHGFQLQASAMVLPKTVQTYVSGSKIFGEYGEPWDLAFGTNVFPFQRRQLRANLQGAYVRRSPVGSTALPYLVGADGWIVTADLMLTF